MHAELADIPSVQVQAELEAKYALASLLAQLHIYQPAHRYVYLGCPYGANRKGLKRWKLEVKRKNAGGVYNNLTRSEIICYV